MNNWDSGVNEIQAPTPREAIRQRCLFRRDTGAPGGPRGAPRQPGIGRPSVARRPGVRAMVAKVTTKREPASAVPSVSIARLSVPKACDRDHTARTPAEQAYDVLSDPARRQIYDREAEEIPIRRMESMRPPETVILRRHRARSLLRSNAEWKGGWPHRPTLLSWKQSVFITDLKGELYQLTAGWRHEHVPNRILRI